MRKDNEYTKQANDFLKNTNTKFSIKWIDHNYYFPEDKDTRDIYKFTFKRNGKTFSGKFGQSIQGTNNGETPTAYDVLACLTNNDPEDFKFFCSNFGYDTDSKKAKKIYKAVVKEWNKASNFWNEQEIEQLREIQ